MYNIHVNIWVDRFTIYGFVLVRGLDLENLLHCLALSMLMMDCCGYSNKFSSKYLQLIGSNGITDHITELNKVEYAFRNK